MVSQIRKLRQEGAGAGGHSWGAWCPPQGSGGHELMGQAVRTGAPLSHAPESQPALEWKQIYLESATVRVWGRRKHREERL